MAKAKRHYKNKLVDPKKEGNRSKEIFISGNLNTSIFEFLGEVGIALRKHIENKLKQATLKRIEEKKMGDVALSSDNRDEVKVEIEEIKNLLKEGDKLTLVSEMKEREIDNLIKTKICIEKLGTFDSPLAREIEKNLLDPNISSSQLKKSLEDKDLSNDADIEVASIVSKYLSEVNTSHEKNNIEEGITSSLVAKFQNTLSGGDENIESGLKIERHRERIENRK